MENNIQDLVDQQNKQNKVEHKKEERQKKIDSFFECIRASIEKRKAKLEAIKQKKAAIKDEEERKKESFEASWNEKYQKVLEISNNPELDGKILKNEDGTLTHVAQRENGCILRTTFNSWMPTHRFEGIITTRVNGVKQEVYVYIVKSSEEDHSEPGSRIPVSDSYRGIIRTASGKFKTIDCYVEPNSNKAIVNNGDVSIGTAISLYSKMEKAHAGKHVPSAKIF